MIIIGWFDVIALKSVSCFGTIIIVFYKYFFSKAGRELRGREKVTAQIISNWFAKKRKELKKLAREGD